MDHSQFTVGIITALPLEAAAAAGLLDEEFTALGQNELDHNSYKFGRIHHHNVAIASLPSGVYGSTPAASVAKDMLRTFKALRFGLMVGIGGALPVPSDDERDIRLGDVAIGKPSGQFGGVVQFDRGKQTQSSGFERTGTLTAPPFLLLTALAQLESDNELGETTISTHLSEMFCKRPAMAKKFGYPGAESDVLFEADYAHPATADTCAACDVSRRVQRTERDSTDPMLFCGTIASSNAVVRDAATRERLREQLGAICCEMEAAGLADFPCLVIRGISDYSDSHKNKNWQRYAAATAAACAKSLLGYIGAGSVEKEKPVTQVQDTVLHEFAAKQLAATEKLGEKIDASAQKEEDRYHDARHKECHQFFNVVRYLAYKNINPTRTENTCLWVLENEQYRTWLMSQKDDLLWILADPGCGKSVLSRTLVDTELQKDPEDTVCYFFFRDNEDQGKLSTALCSLIHQLFQKKPALLHHAISTWEANKNTLQEEPDQLWEILLTAATDPAAGQVYFVLDGVDECTENGRAQLLRFIKRFYSSSYQNTAREGNLKFILTSRPYADIENNIKPPNENIPIIRLSGVTETEMVKEEINLVIKDRMSSLAERVGLLEKTKEKIETKMLSMHNRTYLWAQLVTEELEYNISRGEKVRSTDIDKLPTTVEAAYEKLLSRHTDSPRRHREACIMLHIVAGAKRPMTLAEMDVAFNLATQENPIENLELDDEFLDGFKLATRIRNLCGLFIFVSDERIHLIHQTAKDFLLSTQPGSPQIPIHIRLATPETNIGAWRSSIDARDCDSVLALVCILCLQLLDADTPPTILIKGNAAQVKAFFQYAALFWGEHYRAAQLPDTKWLEERAISLYHGAQKPSNGWYEEHIVKPVVKGPGALAVACELGHENAVKHLIDNGAELDPENTNWNPLSRAIVKNHEENPLIAASMMGYDHMVELLLQHGASLDIQHDTKLLGYRECGSLAFVFAAFHGKLALLQRLFALRDIDSDILRHSLEAAAGNGHMDVVRFLLSQGAPCNLEPSLSSPLQKATLNGHIDIMRLLLAHGARVNGRLSVVDPSFPLVSAKMKQVLVLVRQNLTRGTEGRSDSFASRLNTVLQMLPLNVLSRLKGNYSIYPSPLIIAVAKGNVEMTNLLLDHGAAVNATYGIPRGNEFIDFLSMGEDKNQLRKVMYETPMAAAMKTRQYQLAAILMKRGARLGNEIRPELQKEALQWFVENDVDLEYTTWARNALLSSHIEVAAAIFERRPMVASDLAPLLPELAENKQHVSVKLLLHHGVDPNTRGAKFDKTALHWAAEKGQEETVRLLLEIKSDPNLLDCFGQTPLHYAAENGFEEVVRNLLDVTDVSVVDTKGRTALRCAHDRRRVAVIKLMDPLWVPSERDIELDKNRHNINNDGDNEYERVVKQMMREQGIDPGNMVIRVGR